MLQAAQRRMLVSHRNRFIFLKTGKTAGTSIEIYFEPFCLDPSRPYEPQHGRPAEESEWGIVGFRGEREFMDDTPWDGHLSASSLRALLPAEVWDGYFRFSVVRNPFDKLVSAFWFKVDAGMREALQAAPFADVRGAFRQWVLAGTRQRINSDHRVLAIDGELAVHALIRYESLTADLAAVCARVGVPWEPERLGTYKSEYRRRQEPYEDYYDDDTEQWARRKFARDLELFGYDLA